MKEDLGRINEVDLRTIFQSESMEFTPWLAENLEQLSNALSIEIVDPEIEKSVGDFRLDILGFDANTRQVVAVENQLEASDHNHLGQLITYASGVEAGIVVWITPNLRQEHHQALSWLNDNSDTSFFGVEVRAVQIGDSIPAVDFRVKVAPNDWSRGIRGSVGAREISPRNLLYREFYAELIERYWMDVTGQRRIKTQPQSWLQFGAGKSGFYFGWAFRTEHRFSTELYVDGSEDPEQNVVYMTQLRAAVDLPELVQGIEWEELPEKRACRVVLYRDGEIEKAASNSSNKNELIKWGVEIMSIFENTFRNHIRKL
jgi:hypothetical protein